MKTTVLKALVLLALIPLAACNRQTNEHGRHARGGGGHGLRRACATEIQKYCAGQRGRERRSCLQGHESQLSADCKSALSSRGERGMRHRLRFGR